MKKKILLSLLVSLSVSYLLQAGDKEVNLMKIAERYSSDSLYRYIDNTLPSVYWVAGGSRWFVYTPKIEGKNLTPFLIKTPKTTIAAGIVSCWNLTARI